MRAGPIRGSAYRCLWRRWSRAVSRRWREPPPRAQAPTSAGDGAVAEAEIDQLQTGLRGAAGRARSAAWPRSSGARRRRPPPAAAGAQPPQPTAQVPPGAEGAGGPTGALPSTATPSAASKVFNPDIAVIGDFLGAAGQNDVRPDAGARRCTSPRCRSRPSSIPTRAPTSSSRSARKASTLEEGFLTFTSLPGGLLTKVGKMRAAFGKVNTLHNHVLPWTDRPLVTDNLVGGEDGIDDAGISVARLIPNPWLFLEATGQVFRGDSGETSFQSSERGDLSYVGHLRGYQDITEVDQHRSRRLVRARPQRVGRRRRRRRRALHDRAVRRRRDARWRPLQRSIYHSFVGRTEVIWSRRDQPDGLQSGIGLLRLRRLSVRRGAGSPACATIDRIAPTTRRCSTRASRSSLTYWPSEFSQVRGQYRRTNYARRADGQRVPVPVPVLDRRARRASVLEQVR